MYFHNLVFDGAFIMDWLERNGWEWVEDRTKAGTRTYTTVISDANQVYCIDLYFTKSLSVRIMDSLKDCSAFHRTDGEGLQAAHPQGQYRLLRTAPRGASAHR